MAGSYKHCVTEDGMRYAGTALLENEGDMLETIHMMSFMLLTIRNRWGGDNIIPDLEDRYYRCSRGEEPWPEFMRAEAS